MAKQRILAIIPAYNEAKTMEDLISNIRMQSSISDVLVINDCSTDNTSKIAKNMKVTVVDLPINLGIGGGMQTGYKYAEKNDYDFAVQIDGDGQHIPSEVEKLIDCQKKTNADLVIGSRFLGKVEYQQSAGRMLGIRFFSLLTKLLIGKAIKDSTSGFRLANKKVIKLYSKYYPSDYPEPEVLVYLDNYHCKIEETPVKMKYRLQGVSSINYVRSIYYAVKVTASMFIQKIRGSVD